MWGVELHLDVPSERWRFSVTEWNNNFIQLLKMLNLQKDTVNPFIPKFKIIYIPPYRWGSEKLVA